LPADLLGVPWQAARGHFTPVYVNETLTLDFASGDRFDAILDRVTASGIKYRSQPTGPEDMRINTRLGGRNIYWTDANGHIWEILTISYARPESSTVAARAS
jgi:uncharacterized glyoxalase superfamily protein PhnB